MLFSYIVKKTHLTDTEKTCLLGRDEVISQYSPRKLQKFHCADFQFPSGDTFVLQPRAVHLNSAEAIQ